MVAKYHKKIGAENCIIVSIDKDYKQLERIIYNYIKEEFYEIDQKQAMYNFWEQMVTGDSGDNVNYLKGYGKKWCEKNLKADNEFGYMRIVFKLFKKVYKNKAREMFLKQYYLLKLNAF